jgi:hypothetical protein
MAAKKETIGSRLATYTKYNCHNFTYLRDTCVVPQKIGTLCKIGFHSALSIQL